MENKEKLANDKLKEIVQQQKEAEQKKENSIKFSQELETKQVYIKEKQIDVKKELDEALPALEKAQKNVSMIKPQSLVELRSMANPPMHVKMTLEAVLTCITNHLKNWEWKVKI